MSALAWSRDQRSYLKVLFDFTYKTAEGREISIKKNECLYLLQKTNADWWQVARNAEQRSFYVPATYVREIPNRSDESKNKNKHSNEKNGGEEEDDDQDEGDGIAISVATRPPEDPSYKSMPKESTSAMRNVKKWLAGGSSYNDKSARSLCDSTDVPSGIRDLKVGLFTTKSKSLEREKKTGHLSDRDEDASTASVRSRESVECGGDQVGRGSTIRYGTSPGSCSLQLRLEATDPFRRELETSLDRRNLVGKTSPRLRTRSINSDCSNAESGGSRDAIERTEDEDEDKERPRGREGSASPRPTYARQTTTIAQPPSGDQKILNDKRRTWAVEELMSELTQMCKERGGGNRKPAFQLRCTELKTNFDPLEKLTREIHEMNRARCSEEAASKNVSRIAVNSPSFETEMTEEDRAEIGASPRALKSPRSPKIMDEWNEANILNDCNNVVEGALSRVTPSPDKQSRYRELSSPEVARSEHPSYSNVRVSAERYKSRPKLRLKTALEISGTELRLTPSLEKLASEIKFLPAKKTSETEMTSQSDDSLEAGNTGVDSKLRYKGSLKSKGERKYNNVYACAAIPEVTSRSFLDKRRSRSLSHLESLISSFREVKNRDPRGTKNKPVPLPRTKIPAIKIRESFVPEARRDYRIESSTAVEFKSLLCVSDSGSDNCLQSKDLVLSSPTDNLIERESSPGSTRKSSSSVRFEERATRPTRESLSDDQILSSNASSEALHSESEITATLDLEASSQGSPATATRASSFECAIDLPPGWTQQYDSELGQICFLNKKGDKWFSSSDAEGKIYFFEENSNESSWVLPSVDQLHPASGEGNLEEADPNRSSNDKRETERERVDVESKNPGVARTGDAPPRKNAAGDWPHLCDGNNMLVLKEGIINRTKITENGKKLRKNWSASYAVLTELFLLFFKDAKTFALMKSGQSSMAKPDISVDLNGALVEPGERASSRKNVYMISTVLGLQVLVQSDNTSMATEWFQEIHGAIRKLPFGFKSEVKVLPTVVNARINGSGKQTNEINHQEEGKKSAKISRSRSMKTMKRLDDSLEDLSGSAAERQTKIKAKLRRFFLRRPAVELLVKNGIYKDEPAFGSYLSDVCPPESPRVPIFVKTCIQVLESNEENMKTDGLYRASGNLSQIQKIRLQVDQYKLDVLSQEEDVHVLTGALKLFFRELKEPLIPSSFFKEAVNASMLKKTSAKIQCFREIVKSLPAPNYDTLQFLLKHLLRVTSYQEFNRMHIPNLAIVFGPTLMWPAEESANMALDFMQQNLVIECLLSEYNKIFK